MRPLELLADVLLIIGAGLAIAAGSVVATWLGLALGAAVCIGAGAALTALALKQPRRPPGVVDRGPFEADA